MIRPCGEEEPPTLDELQRFRNRTKGREDDEDDEENEGSRRAKSLLEEITELQGKTSLTKSSSNTGGLLIGDTIEVVEGDLVGMRGKILSLDGSTVKMKPLNADDLATNEVEFLISQVKKHIEVGAHVKVIDGRYANETGTVVAVEKLDGDSDSTAVILTDMTNKEVSGKTFLSTFYRHFISSKAKCIQYRFNTNSSYIPVARVCRGCIWPRQACGL
jgi:transcription elongation factor SPT5